MDGKAQDNQRVFELLFKLGDVYLEKGQYDEAIEKFIKLIDLGEEKAEIYFKLSRAYLLKEQYDDKAIKAFHKTLEYDPDNEDIIIIFDFGLLL